MAIFFFFLVKTFLFYNKWREYGTDNEIPTSFLLLEGVYVLANKK